MDILGENYLNVETGDILLMKCNESFSMFVRKVMNSNWSHTAIAVWLKTDEEYNIVENNQEFYENTDSLSDKDLFLFESSEGASYDILTRNSDVFGCRLIRLRDVIKYYDQIAVRKVNVNRNKFFYDNLKNFVKSYKGVSYERSMFQFISNGLNLSIIKSDGDVVCSDLCARYLKYFNLIPESYAIEFPTSSYKPNDFSTEKSEHELIGKIHKSTFIGNEIMVYNLENDFLYTYGVYYLFLIAFIIMIVIRVLRK